MTYYSSLEDSIHLAIDTGIDDIIITGDFNFSMLNSQYARKINSLCQQFSLFQSVSEPTHFTDISSSHIDLLLVSNKYRIIVSGAGDPFLHQDLRYHCPVFGVFNFSKPKLNVLSVVYVNTTGAIMIYYGRKHSLLIGILFKILI